MPKLNPTRVTFTLLSYALVGYALSGHLSLGEIVCLIFAWQLNGAVGSLDVTNQLRALSNKLTDEFRFAARVAETLDRHARFRPSTGAGTMRKLERT